ncbi:MAG TPA: cytochrome P450 [Jatrophihabitantaceae bacterium]|jgi:cytochrome P450
MTATDSAHDSRKVDGAVVDIGELLMGGQTPPCSFFERVDTWRERGPVHKGDAKGNTFYLLTEMEQIRAACQQPDTFSNSAIQCEVPDPPYHLIPEMLDPPEHGKWRKLMGPLFSPGAVEAMEQSIRARFDEILDEVAPRGHCDFVKDVALRFPNTIFLELMGMPVADAERFQHWETAILHEGNQGSESAMAAIGEVMEYFGALIADRAKNPRNDIISKALTWKVDGEPPAQEDLLSFCLLMFQAGLDTVAAQLTYAFHHLAAHPADRERIVAEPSLIPTANEELLRYYSIVAPGRKVMQDTEVAGCPIRAGDMVLLPLAAANRDPKEFERAEEVVIDRAASHHIAFGAGPHRCLGSHLARLELKVAMEAWHQRIPEYRLDTTVPVTEHAAGLIGLDNLPLVWDV